MAKILFLISTMLSSSYLTEQAKLSHDNTIDKSDMETNILVASKYYVIFLIIYIALQYTPVINTD